MRCQRCQDFMLPEYFTDPRGNACNFEFAGWHCLNCGDVWGLLRCRIGIQSRSSHKDNVCQTHE